ncbi:ribonuclease H-like domain-containing protein [Tanacetum coccineum]|uniref:Ribonuclease H-like domain-containing protein n=1 Tax=Tanacetum coccineum TaxID=301880 RepID=A0ABQ5AWX3_9ASTR
MYVVHYLCQHMHSPLQSHMNVAFRVLRYLKGSLGLGIQFDKRLRVSSYADWAKCPKTRKFVTGFCVYLGKSLVSWKRKKQDTFSKSSTKVEYRSMTSTTCETISLGNLLHSLGLSSLYLVDLHYDNRKVFAKDTKVLKMYRWMVLLIEWMANKLWKDSQLWGKLRKLGLFDMFAGRSSRKATSEECHIQFEGRCSRCKVKLNVRDLKCQLDKAVCTSYNFELKVKKASKMEG